MRKILTFVAVLALAGCGGGGGGSAPAPTPQQPQPSTQPQGTLVTPQFILKIPQRTDSKSRAPKYVSSATLSVVVTLTADSVGITPGTISGNPATTTVSAGSCSSGCTVNGPPTPPGNRFVHRRDVRQRCAGERPRAQRGPAQQRDDQHGTNNVETIMLGAIPVTLSLSNVPSGAGSLAAGTTGQSTAISVVATDGHGDTIPTAQSPSVSYVDATGAPINITVTDPDTSQHGSCLVNSGTSSCTSGAATSVTITSPDDTRSLAFDGLAENPVTITASATGTGVSTSTTANFEPVLQTPVFNSSPATPAGVALSGSAEIDLFAPSGIGSTGTEYFTESGLTNSPYNSALTVSVPGGCSTIATASAGSNDTTNGTPIIATVVGSPVAGSCTMTVSDGLSLNSTEKSTSLTVTYTTSSVNANAKHRHN